jgi:hypothetical protein
MYYPDISGSRSVFNRRLGGKNDYKCHGVDSENNKS